MADQKTKKIPKAKAGKPAALTGTVPEWASTTAIAQLLGYSVRRVQQLTQEGILETEVPPGGGARKYRTCETVQRFISHIEERGKESGEKSRAAELSLEKLEAEVELKKSQGELHRMKTAIAKGEYLPAEQAAEELAEFMATFKSFAMAIPARLAGTAAGYMDAASARALEKNLRKEVEAMLAVFVDAAQEIAPPPEDEL